ncbi:hypothetical protein QWY15_12445 [Planococcus sp. N064]|uniref:Uncharacterized protein n=1 Tax=Planococcus liqunii TaxID=3058394 RepID=A0ABT8MT85_9BACL|nr:hypothetical protein [Planococcus sp. N064]MDN7228109.1 hypothetical protein [Planococcus sp. N064]
MKSKKRMPTKGILFFRVSRNIPFSKPFRSKWTLSAGTASAASFAALRPGASARAVPAGVATFRYIRVTLFIKFSFYQKEWMSRHAIYSQFTVDMEQTSGEKRTAPAQARRKDLTSQASANVLPAGQRKRRDSRDPATQEMIGLGARGKRSWVAEFRRYSKQNFFYIFFNKLKKRMPTKGILFLLFL